MMYQVNFLYPEKKVHPMRVPFLAMILFAILELATSVVFAADVDGLSVQGSKDVYRNPSARILSPGSVGIGLDTMSVHAPVTAVEFEEDETDLKSIDLQKLSLGTSIGLTSFMDFHLNINGVSQKINENTRSSLFGEDAKKTDSDFTGVTGLIKFQLVQSGKISLALAPFAESGSGENGRASLVRSRQAKAGWMALLSYGEIGVTTADFVMGYRYRSTETVGDLRLRNEMFYGATVTGYFTREFGLFLAGQGRNIQASDDSLHITGSKRAYKGLASGEVTGGVVILAGDMSISAFGGKRIEDKGLGYGDRIVGLKLSYQMGGDKSYKPQRNFISDEEKRNNKEVIADLSKAVEEDSEESKKSPAEIKKAEKEVEYDFFGNFENETKDLLSPDAMRNDNVLIQEELDRNSKNPENQGPSEQELRDSELEKLRAAEEAKRLQLEAEQRKELLNERKNAAQRLKEEQKQYNQYKEELDKDLDDLPEFDTIDMGWDD